MKETIITKEMIEVELFLHPIYAIALGLEPDLSDDEDEE